MLHVQVIDVQFIERYLYMGVHVSYNQDSMGLVDQQASLDIRMKNAKYQGEVTRGQKSEDSIPRHEICECYKECRSRSRRVIQSCKY